ncbi:MAG: hypothetical protein ACI9MC_003394 [Kiritimatiellia bacterium]|jgi:hypothetical protein
MRNLTLLGALALTAGACSATDSDLQYRGTLDTKTDGIALFDNGQAGHAAMHGTTCLVDPDGGVAEDIDIEGGDDTVIDVTGDDESGSVLARTQGFLHVLAPLSVENWQVGTDPRITHSFPVSGVTDGRIVDNGVIALGNCGVSFLDMQGEVLGVQQLDVLDCNGMGTAFSVDRSSQTAYVANAQGIASVDTYGVQLMAEGADLLVWSPDADALMASTQGSNVVRALEVDGAERWSTDIVGTVHDIADLGARGSVAIVVEHDAIGELLILDSETGLVKRSFDLPDVAEIITSANGQTIAMVLENKVHYYNLR